MSDADDEYAKGYRAGWDAGHKDGKALGYVDAKVRATLALEAVAATDALGLSRSAQATLRRALDNILGRVE